MGTDPFAGLGNDAWASLFSDTPTIAQLLATDSAATPSSTQAQPTTATQPSTQQLLAQIPVWVWVALGGSLLIVLMASKR